MFGISNIAGKIDLHMHTAISDGTDTPEELLNNIRAAGIEIFSVTDHDSIKSAEIMTEILQEGDPVFIPGVEFSCKDENGKYHILGYGFDPKSPAIRNVVDHGHSLRMKKAVARLDFLKREFGFCFREEDINEILALNNPGKPHIGNLMVKYGFADTKESAIKDYIDHIRFKNEYVRPEEAMSGILDAGGIPVLAHPFYGSGDELILGKDMEDRLEHLIGCGLRGIEAFYSGFSDKLQKEALSLAEKYNLFTTAGSDYHGKNKLIALGDTGLAREDEYPQRLRLFLSLVSKNV